MIKFYTKYDIILGIILAVLCVILCIWVYGNGKDFSVLEIRVNGELFGVYDLSDDRTIEIDTGYGHNQATIKDGKAYMSETDCPDGYCKEQHRDKGGISRSNQTIVCLPNRVVLEAVPESKHSLGQDGQDMDENGTVDTDEEGSDEPDAIVGGI